MAKMKNNNKKIYVARSENDPNAKGLSVWQPERLTLKDGWNNLKKSDKAIYILLLAGTVLYNCRSWSLMPEHVELSTWFGYSQATINRTAYCIGTVIIMTYIVYRDIINRSVSRRKIFIPFVFYLANYFLINGILGNF